MVIDLNDPNELVMFSKSILINFFFDMFFGELETKLSPLSYLDKQSEILHLNQIAEHNCTIVDSSTGT